MGMLKCARKIKLNENCMFLVILVIIFAFGATSFIRSPKKMSVTENRNLNQFSVFNIKTFINGSFQENFEDALMDQFPMSEKIKVAFRTAMHKVPIFGIDSVVCQNHYREVPGASGRDRRAFFNCEDYLVGYPLEITEQSEATILKYIGNYNRINSRIDTYYYYVDNFFAYDFEKNERIPYETMLRDNLVGEKGIDTFNFEDYEDFKKYFYKTDHHWNYVGSYIGYSEITKMMGIKDALEPVEVRTNYDLYYGPSSKLVQNYDSKEYFEYYKFNFPEHDTLINGEPHLYGHYDDYANGNYTAGEVNYYSFVYGGDVGEVAFDYHQPERENLLIISDSYGDPLKELLAASFNKTYAIDLRYYKGYAGKNFVLDDYVKKHNIDKVLFIMSTTFLIRKDRNQGLEN